MKKVRERLFLTMVFLGVMVLLIPSHSPAFEAIKLGEESELSVYGFFRNNIGMFTQSQPYTLNGNKLATARTWFRANLDYKFSDELRFAATIQFALEPWYPIEEGASTSRLRDTTGPVLRGGKEYSEYKDPDDILREAFIEWKPSKRHAIKIGRQIAIWGEALTSRVGDVIHPDDGRFALIFANLEDTRIPQWMIRANHDFPSINSSLEWIVMPNFVQDKYRVSRNANMTQILPTGTVPGQRFGIYPEDRGITPFYIPLNGAWEIYPKPFDLRGGFRTNSMLFKGFMFGFTYFHTQEYNPVVKLGTLLKPYTPILDDVIYIPGFVDQYRLVHPNKDILGFYMNKDLPWPGVVRTEAIYVPNQPFSLLNPGYGNGLVRRNYVKYLISYDLSNLLYFNWHKTAPFNITFEHIGEWIPHNKGVQYAAYQTEQRKFNPSFNASIGTNWRYNQIGTTLIASYSPWGNSGLLMPDVTYTPPVLNEQLSFDLKYIYIFARTPYKGLGLLRTKDMLILTTQLNW